MQKLSRTSLSQPLGGPCTNPRSGVILVWFIVALPIILTLLCVVVEVGHLYLARAELSNALEAAAQAAVKDWAENSSSNNGDTNTARIVGNNFAKANSINGAPVDLSLLDPTLNYDANSGFNQNATNSGVLVFGAVSVNANDEFTFNCCQRPSPCGVGTILFDATGQGNLRTAALNEWGIRFLDEDTVPDDLLITRITITLSGGTFFRPSTFGIGDADNPNKVTDANFSAPDIFGLDSSQITATFLPAGDVPKTILQFDFAPLGPDTGFAKGDRFRFGVEVGIGGGNAQVDGDEIGQPGMQAQILVEFSSGATASGMLVDTQIGTQDGQCLNVGTYDPEHQSLTVFPFPNPIPDLPCPGAAPNNDGQSFIQIRGSGGGFQNSFAVRAQATYPVPSLCSQLFGVPLGPFMVTSKADALYDCSEEQPRLYHLETRNVMCNLPCP